MKRVDEQSEIKKTHTIKDKIEDIGDDDNKEQTEIEKEHENS